MLWNWIILQYLLLKIISHIVMLRLTANYRGKFMLILCNPRLWNTSVFCKIRQQLRNFGTERCANLSAVRCNTLGLLLNYFVNTSRSLYILVKLWHVYKLGLHIWYNKNIWMFCDYSKDRQNCWRSSLHCKLYQIVSKNDSDVAHYNFNAHQPILVG